jgi:hypothetical protein
LIELPRVLGVKALPFDLHRAGADDAANSGAIE